MLLWVVLSFLPLVIANLDLNSIKKLATTPSGSSVTIATTTIGPCNIGCPDQWVPYGGSCYKKMLDVLTQSSAEQECVALGAHLASFETATEATAVKSLVLEAPLFSATTDLLSSFTSSQGAWIGLAKQANSAWVWTDSSSVEFTNLPDGTSVSGASCVSMNSTGTWLPTSCSSTVSSFICKRAAVS